jgi:hypothetical protein
MMIAKKENSAMKEIVKTSNKNKLFIYSPFYYYFGGMINMKRILTLFLILVILSPVALAQGQNATGGETTAADIGRQLTRQMSYELRKQSPEGVRQLIRERRQLIEQEVANITDRTRQRVHQNQNEVRIAVHALLEMDNLTGGIGPQVREIARNFNNSIQATLRAEERIENRGRIRRFFAGGDFEAADEIEQEVDQSRQRIQELKQLREDCPCDVEVKAMLREQIESMEQEQDRLQGLTQAEKQSKGLFGWIWK